MWVSQTYLTNLRADGAVSAYFLYEDYRDEHVRLERRIRAKLASLAQSFGDDAHVFVPSEEDRSSIQKEFNDWLHRRGMQGIELPGILVLDHAMDDERSLRGSAAFISFAPMIEHPGQINPLIDEVKQAFVKLRNEMQDKGDGLEEALRHLQLKPGLWGLGYDFKPHLISLVRRLRPGTTSSSKVRR